LTPYRDTVSGDSSQVGGEGCLRNPHDTRRQTADESGLEPAALSNLKASSPNGLYPFSAPAQVPCAVSAKALDVGHDADAHVTIDCHRASIFPSSDMPKKRYIRPQQPLPSAFSLAQKAGLQSFDELPTPRDFLMVSLPQPTRSQEDFPLPT
jgi:hypothetical protein